jgi:hypothetical protein
METVAESHSSGTYMNSGASITEHTLEGLGETLWNMQRLIAGIKKADEGAYTDAFWTVEYEYAESWRGVHSDSFYAWLTTHTSGDILAIGNCKGTRARCCLGA